MSRHSCIISVAILIFCMQAKRSHAAEPEAASEQLFRMSLQELLQVEVRSLTTATVREIPAAVTRITEEDIFRSGARDLMELLDIYVPGVQWIRHNFEPKHLGTRGIISDRDDKVMIRVNGKVMNERTHSGAVTERDFPMLDDIESIDVISGVGSATYGLGAVSMVIDIHTHTYDSLQQGSVTVRAGGGMNFSSVAVRERYEISESLGLFLYGAIGNIQGASSDHTRLIYGPEYTSKSGIEVEEGAAYPDAAPRDGSQYRNLNPLKLHAALSSENSDFWVRYTRAGEQYPAGLIFLAEAPVGSPAPGEVGESGYQQITAAYDFRIELRDNLSLSSMLSYDFTDYERSVREPLQSFSHAEEEYFAQTIARWTPQAGNELALGLEVARESFGKRSPGHPDLDPLSARFRNAGLEMDQWYTTTVSTFGEWQWRAADDWITVLGGRADKNTYSEWLYSPRVALIFLPTDSSTLKLIYNRSRRMTFAEEARVQALTTDIKESQDEKLDSYELRFTKTERDWAFSMSVFHLDLDSIGFNFEQDTQQGKNIVVGTQKQYGTEIEIEKRWQKTKLRLNHAFTQLDDFSLKNDARLSGISASPNGYGNALANWSDHITKLILNYDINRKWGLLTSLRVYWGFPGSEDAVEFRSQTLPRANPDFKRQFEEQVFLNFGAFYRVHDRVELSLNAYNTLGWIDKDYNKRNFLAFSGGGYLTEAPALAASLKVNF